MSILQTFAINWYLVLAQVVNFLIIFYLLKRFVYKPIFNMLKKREDIIHKGLDDARKSEKALQDAEQERKDILKKTHADAKKIMDEARKDADALLEAAQLKAKKQADIMTKDAQDTIQRDMRTAEERIQRKIGTLIEQIIKKSLRDVLTPEEQKKVIAKTLQNLPK